MEALKAQAVAARSFALYQMQGSGYICPTESCQVYKPANKGGNWETAVNTTLGWVLEKGGSPAPTFYAASAGGFTISQWGWTGIRDTSGAWPDTAYEKIGGSPWFYKAWFRLRSGASCGRNSPWLTSEEMADILNAWKVLYQGGGDVSRVSPLSCGEPNAYSMSELVSLGGYTSVSSVSSPIYGNDGTTLSVTFQTNKGAVTVKGSELKKAFNLRAPGYIGLKSSLFNIEKL
jgi:peptidoglycan hydrolase-like amidase